jgi:hypothetical protein
MDSSSKIILPNPKDYQPIELIDIKNAFLSLKRIDRKTKAKVRLEKIEKLRIERLEN